LYDGSESPELLNPQSFTPLQLQFAPMFVNIVRIQSDPTKSSSGFTVKLAVFPGLLQLHGPLRIGAESELELKTQLQSEVQTSVLPPPTAGTDAEKPLLHMGGPGSENVPETVPAFIAI
jgi:hypothetical protein